MKTIVNQIPHGVGETSAWVKRWSHLVRPQGDVLDLACGHGRHMRWFSQLGHAVTGVDRSAEAIEAVANLGAGILADIENGPWPLMQGGRVRTFDAVVVTNYLWRPVFPVIAESVAPGGILLYETFAAGNETVGKPSRPDFLLQPGELLREFSGGCAGKFAGELTSGFADLRVIAYEDGYLDDSPRFVQRICAVREKTGAESARTSPAVPQRYPL